MYKAVVSSDWNGCLAPTGPFDIISFLFPHLETKLAGIFQAYTGNTISLGEAAQAVKDLIPEPISQDQMDAYLERFFTTYNGVPELIEWCLDQNILFMINTTGFQGFFQRVVGKNMLPPIPVISAHPLIRYSIVPSGHLMCLDLLETSDKGKNTNMVVKQFNIPRAKIIIMGDSGGDGPHFQWGFRREALLVGCVTKPTLLTYCHDHNIPIDCHFPPLNEGNQQVAHTIPPYPDFRDLIGVIDKFIATGSRIC